MAVRRLFLAVRPPAEVVEALRSALAGEDRWPPPPEPGVRWMPPRQWHVTLRFLGRCEADAVLAALATVPLPAATVHLGPRVSRLGRSMVVVPAAGLDALAGAVREATGQVGDPPDPRPFAGHLSVARLRDRAACGVAGAAVSLRFPVLEVELVASVTDPAGAVHEVVARRGVGDADPDWRNPVGNA